MAFSHKIASIVCEVWRPPLAFSILFGERSVLQFATGALYNPARHVVLWSGCITRVDVDHQKFRFVTTDPAPHAEAAMTQFDFYLLVIGGGPRGVRAASI